ncbi:major tail protein [Gordonia phage Schmidt]|uniref:Major tail protein n=1 Tax=Gordonia phage Schmidt TaxID=2301697 RepID=A0A385E2I3_9CAUD|nr:major tail protein [Gordonia phage Schmidt]AXQ65137.1 major tail protein [Gordonia phage Schmidt]
MAYEEDAARLGVTGALRMGAVGMEFPTAMGPWTADAVDLGFISGDGITESRDEDKQEFVPWQRTSPIRVAYTRSVQTFQCVLWESNFHTISLYYRQGLDDWTVEEAGDGTEVLSFLEGEPKAQDVRAFGIDIVDGIYARRIQIPYGEVTDRGDIVYKRDSIIAYDATITAYVGPDGFSVKREFREGWGLPTLPGGGSGGGGGGQ